MSVFLTGASGNVGRLVAAELVRRGRRVTALVRPGGRAPEGCAGVEGHLGMAEALADAVASADGVVHLASPRTNDRRTALHEDLAGTGKLLDAWARGNFVFASSQTVYGVPRETMKEGAALTAACWYDLAKVANELQLQMTPLAGARRAAVSVRMALLFDAGPRRSDRQFLPEVFRACRRGDRFVFGSEQALEEAGSVFIGGEDLARAFADSLELPASGAFNVAGGFCRWRDLVEAFNRHACTRAGFVVRAGAVAGRGEHRLPQSVSRMDVSAFAAAAGFKPRQTLDELVARFVEAETPAGALA
jgi:nucleoside-diphosphate-sugar epimerase